MLSVLKVPEGIQLVANHFELPTDVEWVALEQAVNRRLATRLYATFDVPHYRRSTVDGYAVRATDIAGAQENAPALLPVAFSVAMGQAAPRELAPGTCAYVPTGGHVPDGADAMVMVEYTQEFGQERLIEKSVALGDHIVRIGEDIANGDLVLEENTRIEPRHLGLLNTLGYTHVAVKKRLKAVVLATGDEICLPPKLNEGQVPHRTGGQFNIYDANNALLISSLKAWDIEVVEAGNLKDTQEAFDAAIKHWQGQVDVVLLSGGSSQGVKDLTEGSIANLESAKILLHGLAIQPGKPTIVGCTQKTLYIGLPGHPGACYTTLRAFVEPLLLALRSKVLREEIIDNLDLGYANLLKALGRRCLKVTVDFYLHGASGRTVYQLVRFEHTGVGSKAVAVYGKSGMLAALAHSEGYVILPDSCEGYQPGDTALAVYW